MVALDQEVGWIQARITCQDCFQTVVAPEDSNLDIQLISETQTMYLPNPLSEPSTMVVTGMAMAAAEDSPEWHACKFPFHFLEEL
jgi:hypothetical protein